MHRSSMELKYNSFGWYWVNPKFEDSKLSPVFDSDTLALQWRGRVGQENFGDIEALTIELEELKNGYRVVLPCSKEHAEAMLRVAHLYLSCE